MEDQKEKENRWRQLAELLGLPPDEPPPGGREPASAPPVQHVPAAAPAPYVEPRRAPQVALPPEPAELPEPTIETVVVEEFEEVMAEEGPLAAAETSLEESEVEGPEEAGGAEGDEEKPRRGRRRRRRGRRRGGPDKAEGEGAEKSEAGKAPGSAETRPDRAAEEPPSSRPIREPSRPPVREPNREPDRRPYREPNRDSRDRQSPRGGHRGREENAPVHARAEAEDRWEQEESPVEEVEDVVSGVPAQEDDEEVDILSNWDVPAWQDLIASLYRPDR
jgi:hypothetical protein